MLVLSLLSLDYCSGMSYLLFSIVFYIKQIHVLSLSLLDVESIHF